MTHTFKKVALFAAVVSGANAFGGALSQVDAVVRQYCSFGSVKGAIAPALIIAGTSYALGEGKEILDDKKASKTPKEFSKFNRDFSGFMRPGFVHFDKDAVKVEAKEAVAEDVKATVAVKAAKGEVVEAAVFDGPKGAELAALKGLFEEITTDGADKGKFKAKAAVDVKVEQILVKKADKVEEVKGKYVADNKVQIALASVRALVLAVAIVNAYRDFTASKDASASTEETEEVSTEEEAQA